MRCIEHIVEPDKLLLSWQTSMPGKCRQRMFIAELIRKGNDADLVYLKESPEFAKAQDSGFSGYPGFTIEKTTHENVLASFMKRLPPRSRGDFGRFLNALRLKEDVNISDFALLGYSGAKLPEDDITVINPLDNASPPFELMLYIQDYKYYMESIPRTELTTEMQASFEPESDNENDPQAIRIMINGIKVGYVCRGLTASFHKWLNAGHKISAYVERINGTEHKPKIFIFVSVR
ncbi:MAG: hypothetical protein K9M75_12125 [Phycisphaerae bacterium]|nr:hypothetical protein [Phycisphaerae bacterium]